MKNKKCNNNQCLVCDGTGYIYLDSNGKTIDRSKCKGLHSIVYTKVECDTCGGTGTVDLDDLVLIDEDNLEEDE